MQRWFLADPAMRAHMSLLSERLPLGAPALRRRPETQRGKPRRRALPDYTVEGTGADAESPRCRHLNGTVLPPRRDRGRAELCTVARAERLPPGDTQ